MKDRPFLIALLEQEKQRIEELTAGWDDPTAVDWDNEEKDEQETQDTSDIPSSQPIYKCTALYTYTVSCATEYKILNILSCLKNLYVSLSFFLSK